MTDYKKMIDQLVSLTEDVDNVISNLANASALIFQTLHNLNWAGFYIKNGGRLELGPFQGKVACTVIPIGKGVCGTAAQIGKTIVVPDVHKFEGHIACDSASNSEIVVPIFKNGELYGVLDVDSPSYDRFTEDDRVNLEAVVRVIEGKL